MPDTPAPEEARVEIWEFDTSLRVAGCSHLAPAGTTGGPGSKTLCGRPLHRHGFPAPSSEFGPAIGYSCKTCLKAHERTRA